jgi:hypothetical protein
VHASETYRDKAKAHDEAPNHDTDDDTCARQTYAATRVEWDEDRRQLTDKEAGKMNLSFSTDDEFYKATRDALPWTDPRTATA